VQTVELKLKQQRVLGMPTKELQNLVQFGVVSRGAADSTFFTRYALPGQVACHLKLALGTPAIGWRNL